MALPKIDSPTFELTLPISKKKIKYRSFNVKEQRNLLIAMEADDSETIQQSIGDILHNCTLTEGVDIDKLPVIDVEYYFINLRARSVGDIVDARYKCNNLVDGVECGTIMNHKLDLNNIKVDQDEIVDPEIQLTNNFVIKMRFPDYAAIKNVEQYNDVNHLTFSVIAKSVEYIYDGEQFYYGHEVEHKDMVEFIENLGNEQFKKIEHFFDNLPTIHQDIEITCNKCGFIHNIKVEGLENFFD